MKRFLILVFIITLLAALAGCGKSGGDEPVQTQEELPTFKLVNLTDVEIHEIYISVSNMQNWGDNLLSKNEVFRRGSEIKLEYPISSKDRYDIRCVDSDGKVILYSEINLYLVEKLTIAVDENGQSVVATEEKENAQAEEITEETTQYESEGVSA